ncbi:hypothetical protein LCGC14_1931460 [marine sediment metagenome]|uniref:Uncharacterized protein n=1 Tax=marine sediment metagenome TaxID=412755 RepID=A0A0F9GBC0_9ZZZZ
MRNLWVAVAAALRRWLARDDLKTRPIQPLLVLAGDAAAEEIMRRWVTTPSRSLVVLFDEDGAMEQARMLTSKQKKRVEKLLRDLEDADLDAAKKLGPMTNEATPKW